MINTDNQRQQFFSTRWFQIGVLVALAVALMAGAAYFFGTGLRADTTKSVAASPIGSSLTNVRGTGSSAPASSGSLAVLPKGSSDFSLYLRGAPAILPSGSSDFSIYLRGAPAIVADSYQNEWMGFTAPESVQVKSSSAARAATLAALARRWAPFYAGLDKALTDAGARPSQGSSSGMVESSAADPYQFEWMGLTAPESVQVKQVKPSAVISYQWMKPEGIRAPAAADPAAEQSPWIKPEGIQAK